MKNVIKFFKNEPVLSVSGALAIISCFIVKPDKGYLEYCNFSVLCILFCLMLVVAGFSKAGVFEVLMCKFTANFKKEKPIVIILCMLCFFGSALITNDVALITFVPFTLAILSNQSEKTIIFTVVMETIAANLGSLTTPIGNPQNLYLYTYFNMSPASFFAVMAPLGIISLILILLLIVFRKDSEMLYTQPDNASNIDKGAVYIYAALFVLSVLSVFKIVPYILTTVIVGLVVLLKDRALLKKVDYNLLITFIFFFVFVGNAARIPLINNFISAMLEGRVILVSALLSQIISNVPAATMLSAFTDEVRGLLIGVNIGGLGTLIASMASLISYRQISATKKLSIKRYLCTFSVINFTLLIILLTVYSIV